MLNKALRLIRIFHDKKQSQLAEELGISKSYLSELESGLKTISLDLLKKYGEVFSIAPSSLLLFSEKLSEDNLSERTRVAAARKIVKILEWLAAKEKDEEE